MADQNINFPTNPDQRENKSKDLGPGCNPEIKLHEHGVKSSFEIPAASDFSHIFDGSVAAEACNVEDPVEILVGLAERGEIDPWNINIIEVTDRFLSELERCRQLNLQISGRTLFYAATLLRMKSEQLEIVSESDDDSEGDIEEFDLTGDSDFDDEGRFGPIEQLEREIQRRLDRKSLRRSPITLFELIIELKNLEKEERRRRRLPPQEDFLVEADDVVGIAHEEGYQDSSRLVIEECLANADPDEEITLAELCRDLGWCLSDVYIPLLFLALDGRCTIRQEEFFGDLYVHVVKADE
ncbi:MAG: segregation/condensation protein A [Methanoregula sp.]|uniref:segregation/condensation protein A n=1 Tax=Methanoregula sp. TaxID=2052170 RepID=UPI003BAF5C90